MLQIDKQLQELLFTELKLPVVKKTAKTGPSTDAEVLEELARLHPLPAKILAYRQYAKLKSTYVDALPEMVCPETGRVHASFNQVVAATDLVRSQPNQAGPIKSLNLAEGVLSSAMGRFQAIVEAYPELKADESLRDLSEELTHTENKVAFSRQLFNDATLDYNNAAQQFPANMVAGVFGFKEATMLQSTANDAERAAVKVAF